MKKWLAQGANPDDELSDAIVADDMDRVRLFAKTWRAHGFRDGEGNTPLINATRFGYVDVATYLIDHKADVNQADRDQLDTADVCGLDRQSGAGERS